MLKRPIVSLLALLAPFALTFCGDKSTNVVVPINDQVTILDQCDSVSFNKALGPGTCTLQGNVTLTAFNVELAANRSVSTWRFDPTTLGIALGGTITATNIGGEVHTFTAVAAFGGGTVPALNHTSGNLVEAPECTAITSADMIAPGRSFTTGRIGITGTHLYQCCIHPWMRETVTVTQ